MDYRFYGWQTADITDVQGLTPRDYYDMLSDLWCAETCAPRMRGDWTPGNRTLGQCSITAFLMQDIFGGEVRGVPLDDGGFHCFNVAGGRVFDLTSEQFGDEKLDYADRPVQSREAHFAKAEKRARYELLLDRLSHRRPVLRPVCPEHIERYGEIYAAAFSGPPWHDPWKAEDAATHVREIMASGQSWGLECVVSGAVAGFLLGASMLFHYGRVFEINDLAVAPECQGRGLAAMLLERCKRDMKARGMAGINLITESGGVLPAFYASHGFSREQRVMLMGMEL